MPERGEVTRDEKVEAETRKWRKRIEIKIRIP